ncbi:MAG: transcriptional repressor [Gammaproteobacteria bacterium]|nr:transcriptional repressor [Gammaproteobacteria bacterium]
MKETISHYPLARNEVTALLKENGITPTRQRLEIAQYLFQKQQHLSAERILESVNALGHHVSRATVYNTMGLFTSKGLVREVLIDRERVFYDSNCQPHHHIYNLDTGELNDVEGSSDINVINISGLPEGCRIVDTEVVIKVSQK